MSEIPHIIKHRGDGRASWCVHYNGLAKGDTCDAGVKYADVKKEVEYTYSSGPRDPKDKHPYKSNVAHPCFKDEAPLTGGCQKCRFPTLEEIEEDNAIMNAVFTNTNTARAAIIAHIGDKRGVSGEIDCPVCNTGKLRFSRAACNGHVHARCSTETCVRWME